MPGKNRIMIYGPKKDGTYVVEFRTAAGDVLAISIPRSEVHVIRHFQERMPNGLFVPDVKQVVRRVVGLSTASDFTALLLRVRGSL
jgi:hypothetical protein